MSTHLTIPYRLIKIDKPEFYSLDRGKWDNVFSSRRPFIVHNLYRTPSFLADAIWKEACIKTPALSYDNFCEIAEDIFKWAEDDRLRCVNGSNGFEFLKEPNYKETGNRITLFR